MSEPLVIALFLGLFITFATIIAVLVLRFTTVITQINRSASMEKSEYARELDLSHTQAFSNAMDALKGIQERVSDSQMGMFNRTMDMVVGPQRVEGPDTPYATDEPVVTLRHPWQVEEEEDDMARFEDPTDHDDWLSLTGDVVGANGNRPRSVGVRPGETLVPE